MHITSIDFTADLTIVGCLHMEKVKQNVYTARQNVITHSIKHKSVTMAFSPNAMGDLTNSSVTAERPCDACVTSIRKIVEIVVLS